ncbi:MAG: hypothetical protein NT099_09105 [Candidatus Saganbacteria bacterium]|nr:hypothetical protein [Candidatus Saganbacteria bacterium]
MTKKITINVSLFFAALLLFVFICIGCGQNTPVPANGPIFTDPAVKLAQLQNPNFAYTLFYEAIALDSSLNQTGTHVHMGYWSLYNPNRARLVTVMDAINGYTSTETYKAIWDEGTTTSTSFQYPSYITMNREYWYERVSAINGYVAINGVTYHDPYTVTMQQANDIWGEYSKRYADMATVLHQVTGLTPEARCFVQGAKANRVFYTYELPELVSLEAIGSVDVYFALTTEANWRNPTDWIEGTSHAPTPEL